MIASSTAAVAFTSAEAVPITAPLDDVLSSLRSPDGGFDWVVFTSANGVHALFRRLKHLNRDVRDLGRVKLAAIGPKTAEALAGYHLTADVVQTHRIRDFCMVEQRHVNRSAHPRRGRNRLLCRFHSLEIIRGGSVDQRA